MKYKLIDLFAGTGAFSYAFNKTEKVNIIYANDFNPKAEQIYNLNFKHKLDCKDIFDVNELEKCDILTAGFPCQPFSIAGEQKGFKDERSNVFWKLIEIIKMTEPQIILLENVKNLISHDKKRTFKKIYENLVNLGYFVKYSILNTSIITGIPQHRERIYIVCFTPVKI
jgi:DNA (cytosine-5)-methyltransferase 1